MPSNRRNCTAVLHGVEQRALSRDDERQTRASPNWGRPEERERSTICRCSVRSSGRARRLTERPGKVEPATIGRPPGQARSTSIVATNSITRDCACNERRCSRVPVVLRGRACSAPFDDFPHCLLPGAHATGAAARRPGVAGTSPKLLPVAVRDIPCTRVRRLAMAIGIGIGIDQVGARDDAVTVGSDRSRRSSEFGGAEPSPSVATGGDGGRLAGG